MDRRAFVAGTLGVLAAPLAGWAQQGERAHHIGLLTLGADPTGSKFWQKFLQAMRELNYVEGRNLIVRRAFADGKADRLPGLVADLVQVPVDVMVTTSTQETLAAKRATSTIPIVTSVVPGIGQKYVELLREVVPAASRFAVVGTPNSPFPEIRRELRAAAGHFGITVSFTEIRGVDDLGPALARAKKEGAGGIIAALSAFTYAHRVKLVQLALKQRLPGIYWARDYVEEGGLMSYGASFDDVGRRAAYLVDRILKGAKPADLPIEQPTKFELVINLKTAKALGLTIPPSVLARADEVIE
jgi:putative ABC transport system substrate-binding protein